LEHRQRADDVAIKNADCSFRKIVKASDFEALCGSPDLLGDDLLEGETRNGDRNEFQQIEIIGPSAASDGSEEWAARAC